MVQYWAGNQNNDEGEMSGKFEELNSILSKIGDITIYTTGLYQRLMYDPMYTYAYDFGDTHKYLNEYSKTLKDKIIGVQPCHLAKSRILNILSKFYAKGFQV